MRKTSVYTLVSLGLILVPSMTNGADYSNRLANKRLILENTFHAGMEFKGKDTLLSYAEITLDEPVLESYVKWLAADVFMAVQKGRNAAGCPPQVHVFKVIDITDKTATLEQYWTGWPISEDSTQQYRFAP
jgi:hypothetical protein